MAGHVRFTQRIVDILLRLRPQVVFLGDLFDGLSANPERVAKPWVHLAPPLGAFFVAGDHEEFSGHSKYVDGVQASGILADVDDPLERRRSNRNMATRNGTGVKRSLIPVVTRAT